MALLWSGYTRRQTHNLLSPVDQARVRRNNPVQNEFQDFHDPYVHGGVLLAAAAM